MKANSAAFRVAGILTALSLACGALAESAAPVSPDASVSPSAPEAVRVAQAENRNSARYDDPRPITLGDLYRFEDRINARMDRLEDRIDALEFRVDAIEDRIGDLGKRIDALDANIDSRVARLDARLDTIVTLLVSALVAVIVALLGVIAVLLPRRERPSAPVRLPGADKASPAPAH